MPLLDGSFRCAIVGKEPLLEDEIFNLLKAEGAEAGSIVSFEENPGDSSIKIDGTEECRLYLPLSEEYLKDFDALFLIGGSSRTREMAEALMADRGTVLMDLSSRKEPGGIGWEFVPPAEIYFISSLLMAAGNDRLKSFSWCSLLSASVDGEAGIRELFNQTASILNFKKPESSVLNEQLAFNILPRKPGDGTGIEAAVRSMSGFEGPVSRTVVQVPVFHGSSMSFLLATSRGSDGIREDIIRSLGRDPVFSCLKELSGFYAPEQRSDIQFYLECMGDDRIWGWARFDQFRSQAEMAVRKMTSVIRSRESAGNG